VVPSTGATNESDTIEALAGNDWVNAGDGNDSVYAGDGNDYVDGWTGDDYVDGWYGDDTLYGWSGNDTLLGYDGNDYLYGEADNDYLYGEAGNDYLYGEAGNDYLYGEAGNDYLYGGAGNDTLDGGAGVDTLTGGPGDDRFDYDSLSDSGVGPGNRDIIDGFDFGGVSTGDKIDLSTIDANVTIDGDQAFQFISTAPFSAPGQVNVFDDAGNTIIQLNTDFDLFAESQIQVNDGATVASFWADFDFVL
jgi:Ca2+-binding RTX toxin-like protein